MICLAFKYLTNHTILLGRHTKKKFCLDDVVVDVTKRMTSFFSCSSKNKCPRSCGAYLDLYWESFQAATRLSQLSKVAVNFVVV